ncbi:MAG TPA: hypothetical protein VGK17_24985 [Propionicimonas sp.]
MPNTDKTKPKVRLTVNGLKYEGWKSARVIRGIMALCGGFELSVSDKWGGQSKPWPIREEDECALFLGAEQIIRGRIDRRTISYGASEHSFSVSGRDAASAFVDCSTVLGRGKWQFSSISLFDLAKKMAAPFGLKVQLQPGLEALPLRRNISIEPGETAFEALDRECKKVGVLPVSDGDGGILLTRAGAARCSTALVEGENILSATGNYDATGRFRTYRVMGQAPGSDWLEDGPPGGHAGSYGDATDATVRDPARILVIRPDGGLNDAQAKVRAQWEATVRAARSWSVTVTVQGWTQGDGALWPVNAIVRVSSPMIGVDAEMLITEAKFGLDDGGTTTVLQLARPGTFQPEPVVELVKGKGVAPWYVPEKEQNNSFVAVEEVVKGQSIPPEYRMDREE